MKNTLLFALCMAVFSSFSLRADDTTVPEFSNGDVEHWYYIQFKATGHVIQNNGLGSAMTAEKIVPGKDSQLWKFLGTSDPTASSYVCRDLSVVNKSGNVRIAYTRSSFNVVEFDAPEDDPEYYYSMYKEYSYENHVGFQIRRKTASNYQLWQKTADEGSEVKRQASGDITADPTSVERLTLVFIPANTSYIESVKEAPKVKYAVDNKIISLKSDQLKDVSVYSALGNKVYQGADKNIGLSASGLYILKITYDDNTTESIKVVVK